MAPPPAQAKRCWNCSTFIPAEEKRCFSCHQRVGPVNKFGMARKPIDWWGYLVCIFLWALLAYYIWWAFFKD